MKTNLKDIATVQTGLFAKPMADGEIVYLQAKHFDEEGQLRAVLHPDLKADNIIGKHLLRPGDLVYAAKGSKNFAAVYESDNQPAVASTSFFVIRLREDLEERVIPEYLVWLINQPMSQAYLKGSARGTSIVSISKSVIEGLEIEIPSVDMQVTILQINKLMKRERMLRGKIEALKEKADAAKDYKRGKKINKSITCQRK